MCIALPCGTLSWESRWVGEGLSPGYAAPLHGDVQRVISSPLAMPQITHVAFTHAPFRHHSTPSPIPSGCFSHLPTRFQVTPYLRPVEDQNCVGQAHFTSSILKTPEARAMGPYRLAEMPVMANKAIDSQSTSDDGQGPIDPAVEKRLVRKLDVHVIPVVAFLYMCSFLDRINIGNARIQGLEKDLNMEGQDFNVALFIFFVPYILLEVPSNLLIRKFSSSTWLSSLMVCWGRFPQLPTYLVSNHIVGVVTVGQGVTQSYAGLIGEYIENSSFASNTPHRLSLQT